MAISAESCSGQPCVGMTLETEVSAIIVPVTFGIKAVCTGIVNHGISAANSIKVGVAARTRAGWVGVVMTGGAVFYIIACCPSMLIRP